MMIFEPNDRNQKREVILILPYLNVNATAAERFKSFIRAFQKDSRVHLSIYQIKYPHTKSYFSGMEMVNVDHCTSEGMIMEDITPILNPIQSVGFKALEKENPILWKIAHLLHLLFYRKDIFYPGEIDHAESNYASGYIVVSGSHFSYFYSARRLAKRLGYKLILDYRDPWTFGYTTIDGLRVIHWLKVLLNRKQERQALKAAALVSIVSDSLKQFLPGSIKKKVEIIPNGNNFNVEEIISNTSPETFNLVYAGTIYNLQLQNEVFFKALVNFIKNKPLSSIKLQFVGSSYHSHLNHILAKYNLHAIVQQSGRVKKQELKYYLENASVFLHLKYGEKTGIITSKQADYLAFRKPILLPVSDNGDIAESITKNNAGYVCNTVEENLAVLEQLYNKFQNGESLVVPQSEEMLLKNSRAYIAKEFVDLVLKA
jgi:glycosyltransferase involved in cell wall biosynthesis